MSWSLSRDIAEKFAMYGTAYPREIKQRKDRPRPDPVVYFATLHREIICSPWLCGHGEGEYIIDPRGVAADVLTLAA